MTRAQNEVCSSMVSSKSRGVVDRTVGEPDTAGVSTSAWAPLRRGIFRWLWLGMLISSIGTQMQTVGAQWLLIDEPNAATLVSLVQAANSLPVMLLAYVGGVLADAFDRRWLLLAVQVYFLLVGVVLAVLTALGWMPPLLLLGFTFALGVGVALQLPTWGALIPELVTRSQLRPAARLDLVNLNLSRAVGPALAGFVIAYLGGVPVVFVLNALSVVVLGAALVVWRRPPPLAERRPEPFLPALLSGGRYVWQAPVIRRLMLRASLFVLPAMALWGLLPLVASQRLGLAADGYGVLFGALGVGAIVGALALGQLSARLSTNGTVGLGSVLYAAALAGAVIPSFPVALAALVGAGFAWMTVTSTLHAEMQIVAPASVRARCISIYTVNFMGTQTIGAVLWGLAAAQIGVGLTLLFAAVVLTLGVGAGAIWRVPDSDAADQPQGDCQDGVHHRCEREPT